MSASADAAAADIVTCEFVTLEGLECKTRVLVHKAEKRCGKHIKLIQRPKCTESDCKRRSMSKTGLCKLHLEIEKSAKKPTTIAVALAKNEQWEALIAFCQRQLRDLSLEEPSLEEGEEPKPEAGKAEQA